MISTILFLDASFVAAPLTIILIVSAAVVVSVARASRVPVVKSALMVCATAFACGIIPMLTWVSWRPPGGPDSFAEHFSYAELQYYAFVVTTAILCTVVIWRYIADSPQFALFVSWLTCGVFVAYLIVTPNSMQGALLPPFAAGIYTLICTFLYVFPPCLVIWLTRAAVVRTRKPKRHPSAPSDTDGGNEGASAS
ncbi:hypothetical protein [Corynebacterium lizhenjunii]|uniref:hypothetical protein n=1 Tax=Corynebacterium lizhenjunii TaxID=2709394 RepID=UPI0013EC4269|nr:hypothetical protein [Corynebacterium lizhenjunii]